MADDNKLKTEPDKELIKTAFEQLMEHIRHQDDLCHSWTKFYLSIQSGLVVAFAVLTKLVQAAQSSPSAQPNQAEAVWIKMGSIFIVSLGIATVWCMTVIIWREQFWQGRYIARLQQLPQMPEVYPKPWGLPDDPDRRKLKLGYIGKWYLVLAIVLTLMWIAAVCFALSR